MTTATSIPTATSLSPHNNTQKKKDSLTRIDRKAIGKNRYYQVGYLNVSLHLINICRAPSTCQTQPEETVDETVLRERRYREHGQKTAGVSGAIAKNTAG